MVFEKEVTTDLWRMYEKNIDARLRPHVSLAIVWGRA